MRKQTFIQGAIILLAAGIINRLLGFVPRIVLPRIIGPEGVGLYQQGYPFFIVIITLITGGIPLAVAKLVAEAETEGRPERSRQILHTALQFTVTLGTIFLILCLVFAPWITNHILTDNRVYHTFVSMTPMIIIVAVSSVYRGYFQGKQNMIPSAASSIAETVIRIICVIWFSYLLLPKGIAFAAAGAMLGAMVGELIGMFVLLWQYARHHNDPPKEIGSVPQKEENNSAKGKILKPMLSLSIPVTASRLVGSFSYLLESIVLMRSLAAAGIATAVATAQYGALQGMIIPLLLLPGALTTSLAISLVPSLSEASAGGSWAVVHSRLNQSLRLSLVAGAPFAVLMYVLADPVCMLLYNSTEAAGMLKLMAPFALFIYIQAPLQAALQALNRPGQALINTAVGAIIKIALIIALASRPEYGIYGGVAAICVNSTAVTLLHGYSVSRLLGYQMKAGDWFKTAAGMLLMGGAVLYAYLHLPFGGTLWLQFICSSLIGIALYLVFMSCTGMILWDQLHRIPIVRRWFRT
ncbi:stage V sporulation protein B [Paenibacillus sp. P96]|uniref:Stage V sporulation protein B n=1 Tax=Paenibacillus zeirhizosphaerae TaxID=2987519 RepID=A0ABT9FKR5_9BACL|nr:stage V sporulation protein B [Paenibacillus sp. P96]MDP4095195.1 stage V sporulation protein B [Paenibacillus sp. P96]